MARQERCIASLRQEMPRERRDRDKVNAAVRDGLKVEGK
jgi:hypothetical protein